MNKHLANSSTSQSTTSISTSIAAHEASYAEVAAAPKTSGSHHVNSDAHERRDGKIQFVLTDLHPHIPDWTAASKRSENLKFIPESVDAANAPRGLLKDIHHGDGTNGINGETKVFRLYNLAFHHFDDALGGEILKNTLETADGFGYIIYSPSLFPKSRA